LPPGQRLAGVFSTPPPAPQAVAAVSAPPVAPAPVAAPAAPEPALEPPSVEPLVQPTAEPIVTAPVVDDSVVEPPVAPAQSELPPPPAAEAPSPPALPPSLPQPLPTDVGFVPPQPAAGALPWSVRVAALQKRVTESVPPRWVEIARQYPVLWLVVAPVVLALLLILIVAAFEPEPRPEAVRARAMSSAAPAMHATAEPARAPTSAVVRDELDGAALAALEGKAAGSLTVKELLLLNQGRARQKRTAAKALSEKLQADPALVKDAAVQGELLRFATDPDTASDALSAMAQAQSPIGPDLLYEVWTSRAIAPGTAELARSMLYSRDVRPGVSPALAVALELRGADGCEAVQAALPKTHSDGDARALPSLIKLTSRRGCGAKKRDDCYACLRSQTKQIIAATRAAKARRAPSYPAP
jgi:hypothetical protein